MPRSSPLRLCKAWRALQSRVETANIEDFLRGRSRRDEAVVFRRCSNYFKAKQNQSRKNDSRKPCMYLSRECLFCLLTNCFSHQLSQRYTAVALPDFKALLLLVSLPSLTARTAVSSPPFWTASPLAPPGLLVPISVSSSLPISPPKDCFCREMLLLEISLTVGQSGAGWLFTSWCAAVRSGDWAPSSIGRRRGPTGTAGRCELHACPFGVCGTREALLSVGGKTSNSNEPTLPLPEKQLLPCWAIG